MKELLRLENISYSYEDKFPALKNASVTIHAGERIAVLGNNGAGKSTFFLCCNGVLRPRQGKIFLNGAEITASKADITILRQAVGLVFQDPDSQIIAGTVENEVSFGPMNLRLPMGDVERRVSLALSQMNLDGYQSRAPHYLSGGEKKRVSIADILAMSPDVILLDEPTASLDPENVETLMSTLDALNASGMAVVVSTHDVDFAYRFASRAVVFSHGEIIADGGIDGVFASDDVLGRAGLQKPLLYAAAEILVARYKGAADEKKPRSIDEFSSFVNGLK